MNAGLDVVPVKLIDHASRLDLEFLQVVGGPPVLQTPLRVVLGSLIVEAVADFVSHDDADGAVVHGIRGFHAEGGRLQDSRGKDNLIHQRIVISVGSWRSHAPAPAVYRLANG